VILAPWQQRNAVSLGLMVVRDVKNVIFVRQGKRRADFQSVDKKVAPKTMSRGHLCYRFEAVG
jgi:hypothetical protein